MRFREYILTEQKEYLADKISDILTGVHEMLSVSKQISAKQHIRNAEYIANQIRKILHGSWPRSEHKYLKSLQKCGVALLKAVDDKGDLPEVFNSVRGELEKLSSKMGEPVNKMGSMDQEKPDKPEQPKQPPPPPQNPPPQNPQQPPAQAQQPPTMPGM